MFHTTLTIQNNVSSVKALHARKTVLDGFSAFLRATGESLLRYLSHPTCGRTAAFRVGPRVGETLLSAGFRNLRHRSVMLLRPVSDGNGWNVPVFIHVECLRKIKGGWGL